MKTEYTSSNMKTVQAPTFARRAAAGRRANQNWAAFLILFPLLLGLGPDRVQAQSNGKPPERMTYQGYLVDANGDPMASTSPENFNVIFRIYKTSTGGTALWTEEQIVTVDKGNFSVLMGEGSPVGSDPKPNLSTIFTGDGIADRYIGITVTVGTTPSVIAPRVRLLPAPYAFTSTSALQLLSPGGVPVAIASSQGLAITGDISASQISASQFVGDGSMLTGLTPAQIPDLSASKITSGTILSTLLDDDLQDLANGTLTGSKVGSGINANNITYRHYFKHPAGCWICRISQMVR